MNRFTCLPLILLLASVSFAQDESKEPPQSFVVKLGEKSLTMLENETAKLAGSFTDPQVTITLNPYRVFPYQGVRFQYPRTFNFEADLTDPDDKNWTLSGTDVKIMLFAVNTDLTPAGFADSVIEQFDRSKSKILDANAKLKLGDHTLAGIKFRLTVGMHNITQEAYTLPAPRGKTRLFIVQDNPDEDGNYSAEAKLLFTLLQKSFQLDGK
jgi:hypothetical protein